MRNPEKKPAKMCAKIVDVSNFCHVFAIFECFTGLLVAILIEEVLSFKMTSLTSKSNKN